MTALLAELSPTAHVVLAIVGTGAAILLAVLIGCVVTSRPTATPTRPTRRGNHRRSRRAVAAVRRTWAGMAVYALGWTR